MAPGVLPTYRRSLIDFSSHYLGDGHRTAIFGGRGREVAQLDAWLEDPHGPRHLLVTGPAGRGKSALLVQWLETASQSRSVAFVPVSIRFGTNSAEAFYTILAGKLSAICGLSLPSVSTDIAGTFREICFDLLEQIHNSSKPLLVALDGLDEGTGWKVDRRLLQASSNVRILVSARPGLEASVSPWEAWLERLGWPSSDSLVLDLQPLSEIGVMEVLEKAWVADGETLHQEYVARELIRLSEGDPLLLGFLVEDIRNQPEGASMNLQVLASRGGGFDSYFGQWLKEQNPLWEDGERELPRTLEAVLATLACASGPLRHEDIEHLLERSHGLPGGLPEPRLRALERFVLRVEGGYVLAHPRLGDHLRQVYRGQLVNRSQAGFLQWGENLLDALKDGKADPKDVPPYLLQFYGQHLASNNVDSASFMRLAEPGWLAAWEAYERGLRGFSTDLRSASVEARRRASKCDPRHGWTLLVELLLNSIRNASTVPPALLAACVEKGVVTIHQALNRLDLTNPEERVRGLMALLPHITLGERGVYISEALATAQGLKDYSSRVRALASVVNRMEAGEDRERVEWELLEEVKEAGSMFYWWTALDEVAPVATEERMQWLIEDALGQVRNDDWRYLHAVFPHLPDGILQYAIAKAANHQGLLEESYPLVTELRGRALSALFRYLPPGDRQRRWQEALEVALAEEDYWARSEALASLIESLPEDRKPAIAELALAAARKADGTRHGRVNCLAYVGKTVTGEVGAVALDEALNLALNDLRGDDFSRLGPLVPLLTKDQIDYCYEVAVSARQRKGRAEALSELAEKLESAQLQLALPSLSRFDDDLHVAIAQAALAAYLPKERRQPILDDAFALAGEKLPSFKFTLLLKLPAALWSVVPDFELLFDHVPVDDGFAFFHEAGNLPSEYGPKLLESAFRLPHSSFNALPGLAPHLRGEEALSAFEALTVRFENDQRVVMNLFGLADLFPNLPAEAREKVSRLAFRSHERLDSSELAQLASRLAPHLPEEEAQQLLGLAFHKVDSDLAARPEAFGFLLDHVEDRGRWFGLGLQACAQRHYGVLSGVVTLFLCSKGDERNKVLIAFLQAAMDHEDDPLKALRALDRLPRELDLAILEDLPRLGRHSNREDFLMLIARLSGTVHSLDGDHGVNSVLDGLGTLRKRFP